MLRTIAGTRNAAPRIGPEPVAANRLSVGGNSLHEIIVRERPPMNSTTAKQPGRLAAILAICLGAALSACAAVPIADMKEPAEKDPMTYETTHPKARRSLDCTRTLGNRETQEKDIPVYRCR